MTQLIKKGSIFPIGFPILFLLLFFMPFYQVKAEGTSSDFRIMTESEQGDYIGQGQNWDFSSSPNSLTSSFLNVRNADFDTVSFNVESFNISYMNFGFASADGKVLEPGLYNPAKRLPFRGSYNGIDVSGDGRGCNTILGAFYVHEYEVDSSGLVKAAIDFVQICEPQVDSIYESERPKLFGSIRYNSDVPDSCNSDGCEKAKEFLGFESDFRIMTESEQGDYIGQGQNWDFSNSPNSLSKSFLNIGEAGSDIVKFNVEDFNISYMNFGFASADGKVLEPGLYNPAKRLPFRGSYNGINVYGDGRGCNTILGAFYVHEYEEVDGVLKSAAIDFVQICEPQVDSIYESERPKLFGSIRYNSDVPDSCNSDGCDGVKNVLEFEPNLKPDFIITDMGVKYYEEDGNPGEYIYAVVTNGGGEFVSDTPINVKFDGLNSVPGISNGYLAHVISEESASGYTYESNGSWEVKALSTNQFKSGTYNIVAKADYSDIADESHEDNNTFSKIISIDNESDLTGLPDIEITKIEYTPLKPKSGEMMHIKVFVKNVGDADIINQDIKLANGGSISNLKVGEEDFISMTYGLSLPGENLSYFNVNYDSEIEESNYDNNIYREIIYVYPTENGDGEYLLKHWETVKIDNGLTLYVNGSNAKGEIPYEVYFDIFNENNDKIFSTNAVGVGDVLTGNGYKITIKDITANSSSNADFYVLAKYESLDYNDDDSAKTDLYIKNIFSSGGKIKVKYCNKGNMSSKGVVYISMEANNIEINGVINDKIYPLQIPSSGNCYEFEGYRTELFKLKPGNVLVKAKIDSKDNADEINEDNNNFKKTITIKDLTNSGLNWYKIPDSYYIFDFPGTDVKQGKFTSTCSEVCEGIGKVARPECVGWYDKASYCRKTGRDGELMSASFSCDETDWTSNAGLDYCCCVDKVVGEKPDFVVTKLGAKYYEEDGNPGEYIYAVITNGGGEFVSDTPINVKFGGLNSVSGISNGYLAHVIPGESTSGYTYESNGSWEVKALSTNQFEGGTYNIVAKVDYSDIADESHEDNNNFSKKLVIGGEEEKPDLKIQDIGYNKRNTTINGIDYLAINFIINYKNNSSVAIDEPFYASVKTPVDDRYPGRGFMAANLISESIPANSSKSVTISGSYLLPSASSTSNLNLQVTAGIDRVFNDVNDPSWLDNDDKIPESNENNNIFSKTINIKEYGEDQEIQDINDKVNKLINDKLDSILEEIQTLRNTVKEQQVKIKYLANLTTDLQILTNNIQEAINNFVAYGVDQNTKKLGEGERAAVIYSYKKAFGELPSSEEEMTDLVKIANGRWPGHTNSSAEKEAKNKFTEIYKRVPDMNNPKDEAAITVMAYGLRQRAENRNLNSEEKGIETFKSIYGHVPQSTEDWNIMQAITYSGASRGVDSDKDLLTDERESELGTDPEKQDTDGDGYIDGIEVLNGYDPLKK